MSAALDLDGPFCSCIGCRDGAACFIEHPTRGRMAVCEGHRDGFEVIELVG